MKRTKVHSAYKVALGMAMAVSLTLTSCNESFESLLNDDYSEQTKPEYQRGKVLWIVLDGASGSAVKQANNSRKANTIRTMLNNSVYTFDGLAGTGEQMIDNTSGWANLMTGVTDTVEQETAPSVFSLAKKAGRSTALYASTDDVYGKYGADAEVKSVGDDEAVLQRTLTALKADSVADFSVVEFNGVMKAGKEHGFYDKTMQEATPEVIDAISQMDRYIAKIKAALEQRPKYGSEKWLVFVTSSFGGEENNVGESVYEMKDRNTFSMIYNAGFKSNLLQKPSDDALKYSYFTPVYSGSGATKKATVNDASLFDFKYNPDETAETPVKTNKSYTVQFMLYDITHSAEPGTTVLGKSLTRNPSSANKGWTVLMTKDRGYQTIAGKDDTYDYRGYNQARDGSWHVITIVFDLKNNNLKQYTDGKLGLDKDTALTLTQDFSVGDVAPLGIGLISRDSKTTRNDFCVTNLQIYDVALPADYIAKNYKKTHLDDLAQEGKFEYWDNLIGYWPCDREEDYGKDVLYDYSKYGSVYGGINSGKSDMTLEKPKWMVGSSNESNISPLLDVTYYQEVINNVDLVYQTFQWLQIPIETGWNWEGIGRALPYNIK